MSVSKGNEQYSRKIRNLAIKGKYRMKRFRKWFFKFLTGYDLVEYEDILKFAEDVNKHGDGVIELAKCINSDQKEIVELNGKILAANQRALDLIYESIKDCRNALQLCQKGDGNETLD